MREKGILIVVSGFSGSGKGTIMKELLKQYDNYALSISATTRNPRPGEEDGREYFFKTVEDFEKDVWTDESVPTFGKTTGNNFSPGTNESRDVYNKEKVTFKSIDNLSLIHISEPTRP